VGERCSEWHTRNLPGRQKEVTVTVTNQNTTPVLIQSWIDNGDPNETAAKKVPFVLTPPINRIDASKAQTLRISFLGSPTLPQDRESVFWLNVLEVSAKAKGMEDKSRLNIAFRSRVKLFYRPQNLPGNAGEAMEKLRWEVKGNGLSVTNPSKYYVSLISVEFPSGGKTVFMKGKMIAPGGTEYHPFDKASVSSISQVSYTAINDYGGYSKFKAQ
jgi:chaperone protein EcpD